MSAIFQPRTLSISTLHPRNQANADATRAKAKKDKIEIRVCTNRTCRKQGSLETLQVLSGISTPDVSVTSCGCLGRCGTGPNVVVLPPGDLFHHCGTPTKAANLMLFVCDDDDDCVEDKCKKCLEGLALRRRAEDEMGRGNFSLAHDLLSQALDLKPFGGAHIIYKDRSAASLAMGDTSKALEDAKASMALAPKYYEAYICQGDALMAMEQILAAEESYAVALELDPSIRRSKSFKARISKISEKLACVNAD